MAEQLTQVGYVGYSGTGYTYCTEIITNSQNIQANTSNITVNFKVMPTGNSAGYYQYANSSATMVITSNNGLSQSVDITGYKTVNTRNQYTVIGTWTGTVSHNTDGSLQITCAVTYGFASGTDAWLPKRTSTTFSTYLEQIPRASDITLTTSSLTISGTSGTIGWTATSKADYYHTLTWTLGSSNTTVSGLNHLNNTSQSGTIAYTSLLSALPTASTGTLTLTLITYSNSAKTTEIGRKTATCSVSITIKPTTTLGNIAVASSPITNYAIAGYSTLSTSFSATTPSGATGRTTYFSISTGSMATTSSTSASGTATSNTLPSNVGTGTYTVTISAYTVDSRGNTGTTVSKSITCYQYTQPVANLTAIRTTQTGTTQDSGGSYLYVVFSGAVGSSINGQNSIVTTSCTSSGGVSGSLTSGTHYSLGTDASAKVTLTVTDKVGATNTRVVQVPTAVFPIDMYDNGAGTVGVGLGGIAESGQTYSYLPINNVHFGKRSTPNGARIDANYKTAFRTESMDTYNNRTSFITPIRTDTASVSGAPQWGSGIAAGVWDTNIYMFASPFSDSSSGGTGFYVGGGANDNLAWVNRVYTDGYHPNADAVKVTGEDLSATRTRYLAQVQGYSTTASNKEVKNNVCLFTETGNGWALLGVGGTDNGIDAQGWVRFYRSYPGNFGQITIATLTANRNYYLPDASGTILVNNEANYVSLWTGSLTASNAEAYVTRGGYSAFLVVGKAGSDTAFSSVAIPTGLIGTSQTLWQLGSANTYTSFYVSYNSNTVTVKKSNSAGSITAIYGIK